MQCKFCESRARVLSTRTPDGEFYVVRRYQCELHKAHKFNTVEVLETLIKKIARSQIDKLLSHNRRGAERMRLANKRKAFILLSVARGVKYEAVAADLDVSLGLVRKVVKEFTDGPGKIGRRPSVQKEGKEQLGVDACEVRAVQP